MVLREGQLLGPYRVVALAGSGGMGEVWRARDDRLQRDVALKVIHGSVGDADARRRLLAEARAVTALNHPHIVVVHDVLTVNERDVLVMEFVSGEALSQRIPAAGMKLRDVLKIAIPVADALAAAHMAGVVHRDLKPGNVLVSPSGTIKVLDFGLARRRVPVNSADVTRAADPQSVDGAVSGTPAYMSPEQAEGGIVDHRSDVFSFGALLYELLTGQRCFERASFPETLTAVLRDDPLLRLDWPPSIARIVRRCLRKDPEQRYQHMADVKLDMQEALDEVERGTPDRSEKLAGRSAMSNSAAVIVLVVAGIVGTASWLLIRGSADEPAWQARPLTSLPGLEQQPALSPSGDQVAFMWDGGDLENQDIYLQHVDGATPPLRLTTDPSADSSPCWSPDGRQVAFLRLRDDKTDVTIVSALGGAERRVARIDRQDFPISGMLLPTKIDWSPDGRFIALGTATVSLLNLETGEIIPFTPASSVGYDRDPVFAPDSRAIAYSRGGSLVYRQVWIQRIESDGRPEGAPELLNRQVRSFLGLTWFDETSLLTAVGFPGSTGGLLRLSGNGESKSVPMMEPLAAWYPHYRQTQGRLAYQRRTINADIARLNLGESPMLESRPLVGSTYFDSGGKYSPDGARIVFTSTRTGEPAVWRANSDGTNQVLIGAMKDGMAGSPRWTPDGQSVVFDLHVRGGSHVFIVSAEGGAARRLTTNLSDEVTPSVSRDGRWVYFVSAERIFKVPIAGGQPVEVTSGSRPQESFDGSMLYFSRGDQVWRLATEGGPAEVFKKGISETAWSLAAEELYELRVRPRNPAQLVAHSLQTSAERLVFTFPSGMKFYATTPVDVAPDRRSALFSPVARDESDLVIVTGLRTAQ